MRFSLALFLLSSATAVAAKEEASTAPPPFFLIDSSDQQCLGGETFRRCSIDTLFYVTGAPGSYQIQKRTADGEVADEDDGICISKKSCKEADADKPMDVKLAKCSHCGAKNWNILGDNEQGYVLTEGDGKLCLTRSPDDNKALMVPCDSTEMQYTPMQLQFASATDIETMSSHGARLIGAASDGDKKAIQDLIKEGVDVNVRDWDELTALIPAASSGDLEICKLLVKEGVDVNAKDKDGITALMEASIMGHSKVVEFIMESGAEVDAVAESGVTALWLAASGGRVEVMKILIDKNADASNTRVDGVTAVMTASAGGHAEAVALLLANGGDATITDGDGLTPLMNAAEKGDLATIKALVEHAPDSSYVNLMSNTGFNSVIVAAAHGHADAIEFLLEAGAEVDAVHDNKVTALMYAAAANHVDAMRTLISKGHAAIDVKHTNGGTALLEAATGGMLDAIKILIDHNAEVNFTDDDGVTPLMAIAAQGNVEAQALIVAALQKTLSEDELKAHINLLADSGGSAVMFAAAGGHVEAAKHLMELGADIKEIARSRPGYLEKLQKMIAEGQVQEEEPHVDGVTALHVAAQAGHLEMVQVLVDSGADLAVVDDDKRSALVLAVQGNHGEVANVLVANGADPNTPYMDEDGEPHNLLFDAIMVENEEFAQLLIEKGADIQHKDEKQVSTLLQASHRGLKDVVKSLLEAHAKSPAGDYINGPSEDGITPLIAAASEGHAECVQLLLDAKATVDAKDKDGTNSIMAASAKGHVDVVTSLVAAGASVNEQNADGHTALMFAYNGKNQVETLWERYSQYIAEATRDDEATPEDNGTGPIIKEALESHTALISLLLQNGADESLKDMEGHVAKDFDFHPDTDSDLLEKEARAEKVRDESKNEL